MIPKPRDISYEMRLRGCGLTTLETRMLRGDQIELLPEIVVSRLREREALEDMELH